MNPTAMTVTPPAATQGNATPGKSGDAAADTPFAQIFSGELARKAAATTDDDRDVTLNVLPADALASLAASTLREARPDEAQTADAATVPTGDALPQSEMLLALGMPVDGSKPQLPADAAVATASEDKPVTVADVLGARGGARSAPPVMEAPGAARPAVASPPDTATGALAAAPGTPTSAPDAASAAPVAAQTDTAPAAAAFAERLAAARQAEPGNASERVAELMSHPALRAVAHAAPDVPTAADPAASRLAPSVGSTAWGHALGDKLVWMAAGNQQTASLTLNPPNLGPVHVVLNVSNDQATASFFAAQPEVRQALESAFPKLREMMSDAGIQLGQTTVSSETPRQQDAPQRDTPRGAPELAQAGHATGADAGPVHASVPLRQMGRGLVDRFA